MSPSVLILTLIDGALGVAGAIAVVVVSIVRWEAARRHLREGLRLAALVCVLSLPTTVMVAILLELGPILPEPARWITPYLSVFVAVAMALTLVVSSALLVLKVAVAGLAAPERHPFPLSAGRRPRFEGWSTAALLGFAGGGLSTAVFHLLEVAPGKAIEQAFAAMPRIEEYSAATVSFFMLPAFLAAAVAEEILYRGVLQAWVARALRGRRFGIGIAVTVASAAWAAAHAPNADPLAIKLGQVFLIGLFLGWLSWRHSVEASIVAHASLNVTSVVAGVLLMGGAAWYPHAVALPPPPPAPAECNSATGTDGRDLEYAVAFSAGAFDAEAWSREQAGDAARVTVTRKNTSKGALAHLEYIAYPCGYSADDMKRYFSDESFRKIFFRGYEGFRRTRICVDEKESLTLREFVVEYRGTRYVGRYWSRWDTNTRVLTLWLMAPERFEAWVDEQARAVFPALSSCS